MDNINSLKFTPKQGQYLAFIYYYSKINGIPPAQSDIERYFDVASSSIHSMISTLIKKGLITTVAGKSRSVRVLLPRSELPYLE